MSTSRVALNIAIMDRIEALGGECILTEQDIADFSEARLRVLLFMLDGQWHTREKICLMAGTNGVPASEGLRRMRELRSRFTIERKRCGDSRQFLYRLVLPEAAVKAQGNLW